MVFSNNTASKWYRKSCFQNWAQHHSKYKQYKAIDFLGVETGFILTNTSKERVFLTLESYSVAICNRTFPQISAKGYGNWKCAKSWLPYATHSPAPLYSHMTLVTFCLLLFILNVSLCVPSNCRKPQNIHNYTRKRMERLLLFFLLMRFKNPSCSETHFAPKYDTSS